MPWSFWPYAVQYVQEVENYVVKFKETGKTPAELLLGESAKVNAKQRALFAPFGVGVTFKKPLEELDVHKFECRAQKGVALSLGLNRRYMVADVESVQGDGKVHVYETRDVVIKKYYFPSRTRQLFPESFEVIQEEKFKAREQGEQESDDESEIDPEVFFGDEGSDGDGDDPEGDGGIIDEFDEYMNEAREQVDDPNDGEPRDDKDRGEDRQEGEVESLVDKFAHMFGGTEVVRGDGAECQEEMDALDNWLRNEVQEEQHGAKEPSPERRGCVRFDMDEGDQECRKFTGLQKEAQSLQESAAWFNGPAWQEREPEVQPVQRSSAFTEDDDSDKPVSGSHRGYACVAEPVKLDSEEGRSAPAARAIDDEMGNMNSLQVWLLNTVCEQEAIPQPEGEKKVVVVDALLKLFVKNKEKKELRKFKARVCANGKFLCDEFGRQLTDVESYMMVPMGLRVVRLVMALGVIMGVGGGGSVSPYVGDVSAAYLHSELDAEDSEEEYWIKLPRRLWPKEWEGVYNRPCVRLKKALYGLKKSGFSWRDTFEGIVKELGFERLQSEDSVYVRREGKDMAVIGIYVDDVLFVASTKKASAWKSEIEAKLPIKFSSENDRFLGLDYTVTETSEGVQFVWRQEEYIKMWIERFEEELVEKGLAKGLKDYHTPAVKRVKVANEGTDKKGVLDARKYVGALMYVSRGCRGDVSFAVGMLAREVAKWTEQSDIDPIRIWGYLKRTAGYGLVWKFGKDDLDAIRHEFGKDKLPFMLRLETDADH
jgi:hypothetical protein